MINQNIARIDALARQLADENIRFVIYWHEHNADATAASQRRRVSIAEELQTVISSTLGGLKEEKHGQGGSV